MDQQDPQRRQQQADMGSSMELASQALAATGAKSTLKATEWILSQRHALAADASKMGGKGGGQAKLDHFLQSGACNVVPLRAPDEDGVVAGSRLESADSSPDTRELGAEPVEHEDGDATAVMLATADSGGGGGGSVGRGWTGATSGQEDVAAPSLAHVGGPGWSSDMPDGVAEGPPKVATLRKEEGAAGAAGGLFMKHKRFMSSTGSNPSSGVKRYKQQQQQGSEGGGPSQRPAPIFLPPQARKAVEDGKQKVGLDAEHHSAAPLAERMRPTTVDEILGQDHLLGQGHMLRALIDSDSIPSMILYGPPGTGKTTLARAIARTVAGLRFVGMSAVKSGTSEVKKVLEDAHKRVRRLGKKTLLFLDEVHRFNKAVQDLFLPAVEGGDIIFVGATTENPSFEINSALLSRCHVLTLHKLGQEHLKRLLERAITDRDRGVVASLPLGGTSAAECVIQVGEDALTYLAGAADGDARVALNAMEMATVAAHSEAKSKSREAGGAGPTFRQDRAGGGKDPPGPSALVMDRGGSGSGSRLLEALIGNVKDTPKWEDDYTKPFKRFVGGREVTPTHNPRRFEKEDILTPGPGDRVASLERKGSSIPEAAVSGGTEIGSELVVAVTLERCQEPFQRSHVHYDKTGEEHYNIISALHKSMRGGDADAAIYWLARMLEGGEGPLYVARRLVRFASEDVGLADPQAMGIAVACYQACHFLGMPECNVNLAQCVVYLAYAPKSVVVYQAIQAAQKIIKETKQNEPVPFHLRNAPTKLMKEMGYGKGYIYPPDQDGAVEQEFMPPSLQGHKFLRWPRM